VAVCCPPILVNFAHHFLRHGRGLPRHWHHLHIVAKIAVGAVCMSCPAAAVIPPFGPPPYIPVASIITPPEAITPGFDNVSFPPAWGARSTEEAMSPSRGEDSGFPGASGFLPLESTSFPTVRPSEGELPGPSPIDSQTLPVITPSSDNCDTPVSEPAGRWMFGLGLGGLALTRFRATAPKVVVVG
jgi:hypothetical protein